MKVQEIITDHGKRYILLDDRYCPVDEVKRYLKHLDTIGKSPNTLKNYAHHLKLFYEYMAEKEIPVMDLFNSKDRKPIDILSEFIVSLQFPDTNAGSSIAARKNVTVNIIMDTVLSFYRYLAANNELEELEVYRMQRQMNNYKSFLYEMSKKKTSCRSSLLHLREDQQTLEFITREQYELLLHSCTNTRDRLLLAILFEGGLRLGEALGIHLADVEGIHDGIIRIVPRENNENDAFVKNHAGGIIKLPDYVVDLLLDYLTKDIIEYDSDFLFLNLWGPTKELPLKASTVEQMFIRLSKKVGFEVHPHMLRHGFATEKKTVAGWSMEEIAAYLRHKNVSSTSIYVTFTNEYKKEKIRDFFEYRKAINGVVEIGKSN